MATKTAADLAAQLTTRFAADPAMAEMPAGAMKFSMRGVPLLAQGASYDGVAATDNLWLSIKVYASGGENALHAHLKEDHAFVVLQGRATFYFEDGGSCEALSFEGVMLPKGAFYRFEAGEEENLVLLRIGGAQRADLANRALQRNGNPAELKGQIRDADGSVKNGRDPKTGTPSLPIIKAPGQFFPKT
jgi:mannose-6-phosphate isomerase-like protein (cupin superfamily)